MDNVLCRHGVYEYNCQLCYHPAKHFLRKHAVFLLKLKWILIGAGTAFIYIMLKNNGTF